MPREPSRSLSDQVTAFRIPRGLVYALRPISRRDQTAADLSTALLQHELDVVVIKERQAQDQRTFQCGARRALR